MNEIDVQTIEPAARPLRLPDDSGPDGQAARERAGGRRQDNGLLRFAPRDPSTPTAAGPWGPAPRRRILRFVRRGSLTVGLDVPSDNDAA